MEKKRYVWFDGKFVAYEDAKVPILTHSLQYGSGVFEGIRAYKAKKGTAIFRLDEHVKRFFNSAKIYGMELGLKPEQLKQAIIEIVKKNGLKECYIRPLGFYNDDQIGLSPIGKKVSVAIAAVEFGSYFKGKDKGIRCRVSAWQRINSLILPPEAKGSGNYLNSIIASLEAKKEGADEAILLSIDGYVSEGPGENIFFVQDEKLLTPSKAADILLGITRDTVMKLAERRGLEVEERDMHREEMYTSDEAFFTGTAAELTPITEIDSKRIGNGKIGPITKMLIDAYSGAVRGEDEDFEEWLTYVNS